MDMDMPGTDITDDVEDMTFAGYNNYDLQHVYWILVGSVVAFATFVNIVDQLLLYQRLKSRNAKPISVFWSSWATLTAVGREIAGASAPTVLVAGYQIRSPVAGPVLLVSAYSVVIVVLMFIGNDPSNSWNWEQVAVRIGVIVQAQLPLLFLLAGKQNLVGFLTGLGYERLNWFHRWVGRIVWVGVTMHLGFFFRDWARWNYIKVKLSTDNMTQTGFAGWCILTVLVILSFAPIRSINYELFVAAHIVLVAGFVGTVMIHVDFGIGYVWACVALYLLDRVVRFATAVMCNLSFGRSKHIWANQATLTALPGDVTHVSIERPVVTWKPGQHMFLSCHSIVPLQTHPFTVASLPSDGKLEFLIRSRRGGTKRLFRWASKQELSLANAVCTKLVAIEGPYGHLRPLQQFDSVTLLAGGTGATFTLPLMRDLVRRWSTGSAVTRRVRFVWVIKSRDRVSWFQSHFEQAIGDTEALKLQGFDVQLDISIYITCDEALVSAFPSTRRGRRTPALPAIVTGSIDSVTEKGLNVDMVEVQPEDCSSSGDDCCCRAIVEEEGSMSICCCRTHSSAGESTEKQPIGISLKMFSGRPHLRNVIRSGLEEAAGESAVVVCGPQGLRDDVRRNVIGLSDERAVHKGTGAQGIYLHAEGFGY